MRRVLKGILRSAIRDERGGISIFIALLFPALILIVGIATDIALLNMQKKTVQAQADLAAESAVMLLPDVAAVRTVARRVMRANDRYAAPDLTDAQIVVGMHSRAAGFVPAANQSDGAGANAVQVIVPSPFRAMLLAPVLGNLTVTREAVAAQQGTVAFTLRNTLLNVDTARSPVVTALVGQSLGVNLSAASYTGLIGARVKLSDFLGVARANVTTSVVTWGDVLTANIPIRGLLAPYLPSAPTTGTATVKLSNLLAVSPELAQLRIGDVLPDATLNVFDLVTAVAALSAQNKGQRIGVSTGLAATGLANVSLGVGVVRPPVTAVMRVGDNPQMQASVAQTTVDVQADAAANLIRAKLVLNLGSATATPLTMNCSAKSASDQLATFQVATGAATLKLNIQLLDPQGRWQPNKDGTPVTIGGRTTPVTVRLGQLNTPIQVQNPVTLTSVTGPVKTVLTDLKQQTEAQKAACTGLLGGLGCVLGGLLGGIVGGVAGLLTPLITGLDNLLGNAAQIDGITSALLDVLGIRVAPAELIVHSFSCAPALVR